jgi:MFS family permease
VDSAGWYAGLLGSAFNAGRYVSFIPWKMIRHNPKVGVKKSLILSLFLSSVCSLWFGFSRSYLTAVLARFCLGLSNSLSGCVKRISMDHAAMAAKMEFEKQQQDELDDKGGSFAKEEMDHMRQRKEELVPAAVLSVMMWGSTLGPFLGGWLSNPGAYSEDTFMPDPLEKSFPFLLPNLVGAILCLVSMAAVTLFISEEKVEMRTTDTLKRPPMTVPSSVEERQTLLPSKKQDREEKDTRVMVRKQLFKSALFRIHFLAYVTFSFVVVCIDEALPLFLIARLSGPGLSPLEVGWIISAAAFLTTISQLLSLKKILIWNDRDALSGYYPGLRVASLCANVPSVLIPLVLVLNGGTYCQLTMNANLIDDYDADALSTTEEETNQALPGVMNAYAFAFLAVLIGVIRKFSTTYFSMIGIATSRIVPHSHREEAAHVMTQGALLSRSISPVVAGIIVSLFMAPPGNMVDAFRLWAVIGLLFGLGAAAVTFRLNPGFDKIAQQRSERRKRHLSNIQRARIHFRLWEVHYDKGSETVAAKWRKLTRKVIAFNRLTASWRKEEKDADLYNATVTNETVPEMPSQHARQTSWIDHIFQPGLDLDNAEFLILGTHKHDPACAPHVLTPPLMKALQGQLPYSCSDQNFWIRYSLSRDGDSFAALEIKILLAKNTIFAVETLQGDVFGCFMTNQWRKTGQYEMCGESFLWRMKHQRQALPKADEDHASLPPQDEHTLDDIARREGDIEIYRWTGNDENCQFFSKERIGAGGGGNGFGFVIDESLWRGSSAPSVTYGNPILVANPNGDFEVANIEVWAMTPFVFEEEAEKLESSRRFIHDNVDPYSITSTWVKYV